MTRSPTHRLALSLLVIACCASGLAACGDDGPGQTDAQPADARPGLQVTTEHCGFEPVPATARAGGQVQAGPLMAGVAEARLEVPVGTTLGAYTARASFLGGGTSVDSREVPLSGAFSPSVGVQTAPRIKALALSAGGETVLLMKLDIGLMYEGLLFDLEARLGPEMSGKVLLAVSHSHSGWGQFSGHSGLMVGVGQFRQTVYRAILDQTQAVAESAIADLSPARLGVFVDRAFDPGDAITRDRRGENDELMGGPRKDDTLVFIRVDALDGTPRAAVPIFGIHGTLNDADNILSANDAPGAIENALEESFESQVLVMHLQGAAGDVSPVGRGRLDCGAAPGDPNDPCFEWLRAEGLGQTALPTLRAAWQQAGADMAEELALEMLTRSIELGPRAETFTIRDGALAYAPFDPLRLADGQIYDGAGAIISPIDEFNAPVGAALCGADSAIFPNASIAGTEGIPPYGSCIIVERAGDIFSSLMGFQFETSEVQPICQSTRTTVSALRLGDHLIATLPGEPTVWAADLVREGSPVAPDKTIVVGYSQGHIGYLLRPEDWLLGGYEPSIGFWGPLEAEYVIERVVELMPLAMSPEREDGAAGGVDRLTTLEVDDGLVMDDPAPMAGTLPDPGALADVWLRAGPLTEVQPAPQIARVSGLARFAWVGDDPLVKTPVVTLEREGAPGVFQPVRRRSGRDVTDDDIVVSYTPLPLRRENSPQTHHWAVEWQAVPWRGADAADGSPLDTLEARAALPLGRYRFAVQGDGWQLSSDPFEIVPATLLASAARQDQIITVAVTIHAPGGYRLLDMDLPSNQPVPVRAGTFTVELERSTGAVDTYQADVATDGTLVVDAGATAADVVQVRVIDPHGNTGAAAL